jgi:hypothetical protein
MATVTASVEGVAVVLVRVVRGLTFRLTIGR